MKVFELIKQTLNARKLKQLLIMFCLLCPTVNPKLVQILLLGWTTMHYYEDHY
jgi:BarA-like signal transduction histidine kinase